MIKIEIRPIAHILNDNSSVFKMMIINFFHDSLQFVFFIFIIDVKKTESKYEFRIFRKTFFQLSLIDRITEPSKGVCSAFKTMQKAWGDAASQFVYGTAPMGFATSKFVALTAHAREEYAF